MGRLKQDHSGYRSHGLWLKYKSPTINEKPVSSKSRKDTRIWCGGKKGREHVLYRYYPYFGWDQLVRSWIYMKCRVCDRRFHRNDNSIPLEIPIEEVNETMPVQVKVNGLCLPIDPKRYLGEHCEFCGKYH